MRAPQFYTPEELNLFMRKNKPFKMAWQGMASVMRARDLRGVKRWVFALGWLCCAFYYREFMRAQHEQMAERMAQEYAKQAMEWTKYTGLIMFERSDITNG